MPDEAKNVPIGGTKALCGHILVKTGVPISLAPVHLERVLLCLLS
ncbi:hypothetical protein CHCC20375_4088 [Bacillus licheniformis]|nr:hypothetical protein CHCC20375_4088 [Bacillus licheniformis]